MNEKTGITEQTVAHEAESGDIMEQIQGMIGNLLKNTVDKMQKTEMNQQLGGDGIAAGDIDGSTGQMDISEIKNFVNVMQKFIDNVNVVITQLETGKAESGDTDDKFLEGYMATADNVLEIAAFSMKDQVTGLSNRYGFDNRLILEWNRATRDKTALSLVIFGVDGFKGCEDAKRDQIFKTVSETLDKSIKRTTDFIARWSNDEFAALLPITGKEGASIVAERIRTEIESIDLPGMPGNNKKTAISIGVCVHTPEPNEQPVIMINKVNDAFIVAKEANGSSIVFA